MFQARIVWYLRLLGFMLVLIAGICRDSYGQRPMPIGTAAGYGLAGMTEARSGEAALWNPALAGIFDGPIASLGILAFAGEPRSVIQGGMLAAKISDIRSASEAVASSRIHRVIEPLDGNGEVGRLATDLAVQWIGLHSRDWLISLSSYATLDLVVPQRAVGIMFGREKDRMDEITPEELEQSMELASQRSIASVLAVAKSHDLGVLPFLGRTWIGATLKAGVVHEFAIGRFTYGDDEDLAGGFNVGEEPAADGAIPGRYGVVYEEVAVEGTRVYGADVGIVALPMPSLMISATIGNIIQKAFISDNGRGAVGRRMIFAGSAENSVPFVFPIETRLNPGDEHRPWLEDADYAAQTSHFMPVLRSGVSLDTQSGRLLVAAAVPLESGMAVDRFGAQRFSVGWQGYGVLRPRISYSTRFDGGKEIGGAIQHGFCHDRFVIGGGYLMRPDLPRTVTLSVSWSRGQAPCGRFR